MYNELGMGIRRMIAIIASRNLPARRAFCLDLLGFQSALNQEEFFDMAIGSGPNARAIINDIGSEGFLPAWFRQPHR